MSSPRPQHASLRVLHGNPGGAHMLAIYSEHTVYVRENLRAESSVDSAFDTPIRWHCG
jgi:hypothetical protein